MSKNTASRSWFCVFNNPVENGFDGEPQKICDDIVELWVSGSDTRSCACIYCISADGLHHCHVVLEDNKVMRFSSVKKLFPSMHIEPTKGNKKQAEDYINKVGAWEEKGETIIAKSIYGELKGRQGKRSDLDNISELLEAGLTPREIMAQDFKYRRYSSMIRGAYFQNRIDNTPLKREVNVYWHVGESGSGKTYEYLNLCAKYGEDNVYMLNDYDKGGFDNYCGEKILCMDEFRGQLKYSILMNYLDGYKIQVPCRYSNSYALWEEIHIFTVVPPELVYEKMVSEHQNIDTYEQLKRRINYVVYHWKETEKEKEEYLYKIIPMSEYVSYSDLKNKMDNYAFECFAEVSTSDKLF